MERLRWNFSNRLSDWCLLLVPLYAPWHGSWIAMVERSKATVPVLGLPIMGLANSFVIAVCLWALVDRTARLPFRRTWPGLTLALSWPGLHLLHLTVVEGASLVSMENALLLGFLIIAILHHQEFSRSLPAFRRFSLPVFVLSYSAAFLPLILEGHGHSDYKRYGPILRYVGFSTGPETIAFSGLALGCWCAIVLSTPDERPRRSLLASAGVAFSCLGLWLTVLRIGIAAQALVLAAAGCRAFWHRLGGRGALLLAGSLVMSCALASGRMMAKSQTSWGQITAGLEREIEEPVPVGPEKGRIAKSPLRYRLADLERIMNSNGRVKLTEMLMDRADGHAIAGLGTGSAVRYLRSIDYPIQEPHNDFLRIYVDHGLIGLSLFAMLAVCVLIGAVRSPIFFVIIAFGLSMLTDNILVYPSFAYAPLLLGCLAVCDPEAGRGGGTNDEGPPRP